MTDRTGAESLIKAILLLDTDADKLPEEPDAWYDHQLVGLKAMRDGVEVGEVIRVEHMPAQDLLIISSGEREVMLPFVKAMVPSLDIKAGTITVTPPIGLFEEVLPELATPEPALPAEDAAQEASEV
ncbi:MAG: ribosome maturation factor RimM [Actinomycetota bacterium]